MPIADWHKCMYCEKRGSNYIDTGREDRNECTIYDHVCDDHLTFYYRAHPEAKKPISEEEE